MSLHNLETQVQSQNDRPQDGHLQNTPSAGVILLEKRQAAIVPTSNETETTQEASNAIVRFGDQQELEEDTEIEIHRITFKIWENDIWVDQQISTEMDRL
ncbi:MAG: hypothetical protein M1813_000161 [Trichoglossum hirsutum]|nr:MAG: hypothetical protein M1813_000161 [Trichoglossum hirsutum]